RRSHGTDGRARRTSRAGAVSRLDRGVHRARIAAATGLRAPARRARRKLGHPRPQHRRNAAVARCAGPGLLLDRSALARSGQHERGLPRAARPHGSSRRAGRQRAPAVAGLRAVSRHRRSLLRRRARLLGELLPARIVRLRRQPQGAAGAADRQRGPRDRLGAAQPGRCRGVLARRPSAEGLLRVQDARQPPVSRHLRDDVRLGPGADDLPRPSSRGRQWQLPALHVDLAVGAVLRRLGDRPRDGARRRRRGQPRERGGDDEEPDCAAAAGAVHEPAVAARGRSAGPVPACRRPVVGRIAAQRGLLPELRRCREGHLLGAESLGAGFRASVRGLLRPRSAADADDLPPSGRRGRRRRAGDGDGPLDVRRLDDGGPEQARGMCDRAGSEPAMTHRPTLLAVTSELPWPLASGGHLRTYHLLASLARRFDVRLVVPSSADEAGGRAALARAGIFVRAVPIGSRHALGEGWRIAEAAVRRDPYVLYWRHRRRAVRRALRDEATTTPPDVLYLDHLDSYLYAGIAPEAPVVIDMHNVYSTLAARAGCEAAGAARRWYLREEAALLQRKETAAARSAHTV